MLHNSTTSHDNIVNVCFRMVSLSQQAIPTSAQRWVGVTSSHNLSFFKFVSNIFQASFVIIGVVSSECS